MAQVCLVISSQARIIIMIQHRDLACTMVTFSPRAQGLIDQVTPPMTHCTLKWHGWGRRSPKSTKMSSTSSWGFLEGWSSRRFMLKITSAFNRPEVWPLRSRESPLPPSRECILIDLNWHPIFWQVSSLHMGHGWHTCRKYLLRMTCSIWTEDVHCSNSLTYNR